MKKMLLKIGFILLATPTAFVFAHDGATGIVKERMDMFKKNQNNLKVIKSHIRSEDYDSIMKLADEIRDWAVKMPEYFPEGSNNKPSEASPAIWADFGGFKDAALKNEKAAEKLVAAAQAENRNEVVESFKAVAASCKSCHQSYKMD